MRGCGFRERCWTRAEESHDVALLPTVNQGLARELAARGVRSVDELLSSFDEGSLAVVRYGDGRRRRRVGGSAETIPRSARVFSSGKEEPTARADLPDPEDCVLFDLEGMPAHLDDLEKIYLWGLKVVENGSSRYLAFRRRLRPRGRPRSLGRIPAERGGAPG